MSDEELLAGFAEIAAEARDAFTTAVDALTVAVHLAADHRRLVNELMQAVADDMDLRPIVMATTRLHDLTRGRLDATPVDPVALATECAVRAVVAAGLTWPGQPFDLANGPSTQLR